MMSAIRRLWERTRVSGAVAPILSAMQADARPGYAESAARAIDALRSGQLAGIQATSSRFWITVREPLARPAPASSGALFQCLELANPPHSERDIVGWIVVADNYAGGPLVLVHELSHFFNRFVVRTRAQQDAELVLEELADGIDPARLRWTRAQLLNEIAARHMAWLSDTGIDPGRSEMPEAGALFACAVKIASYPEVYHDAGVMQRLLERQRPELLRDQVGRWFSGLRGFGFFEPGSAREHEHARWLESEIEIASRGRDAPETVAGGTP